MRLIDADALWLDIANKSACLHDCCPRTKGKKGVLSLIDEAPTIEAKPVRHGQWIECDYKCMEHGFVETYAKGGLCCSECKTGFKKSELRIKSYCPNCGAAMTRSGDQ